MGQGRVEVNPTDDVYPRTSFAGPGSDTGLGISREEKDELIKERQDELIKVLDKHDDLVREQFHLEKYVSLLWYDPVDAKKDQSPVFLEYKDKYDLIMNTSGAGPSRKTRRAQNDRFLVLTNAPQQSASTQSNYQEAHSVSMSAPNNARAHPLPHMAKGKQRAHPLNGSLDTTEPLSSRISLKARGKLS